MTSQDLKQAIGHEIALAARIKKLRRELWLSRWRRWCRGLFGLFL